MQKVSLSRGLRSPLIITALLLLMIVSVFMLQAQEDVETPIEATPEVEVTLPEVDGLPVEQIIEPLTPEATEQVIPEVTEEAPIVETEVIEPTAEPTVAPTEEVVEETPIPESLPAEPSLFPLFADNFDSDILTWTLGAGWAQIASEGGQALQGAAGSTSVVFAYDRIPDVAVAARFNISAGSAGLSVRESGAGSYQAVLSADGSVTLLRAGQAIGSASVNVSANQWHWLRLSAMGNVVRVGVDGADVIAVSDAAPLPPGTITISGSAQGTVQVDDFQLWIPDLPPANPVQEPAVVPTDAPVVVQSELDDTAGRGHGHGPGGKPGKPGRPGHGDDGPIQFRPWNGRVKVKVLTIAMLEIGELTGDFPGEAQHWIEGERMERVVNIPGGFSPAYCNRDGHCLIITGVGFSNAASSVMAAGLADKLDLRDAYILIAGIAGVDPADGTLGSAAWADWVVDGDLAHHIDAREMPSNFNYPMFRLNCYSDAFCPDGRTWGVEVYQINTRLVDWAYALTQGMTLNDNAQSQAYRANYPANLPASQPPSVIRCDSLGASTYWHGTILSDWANWWIQNWSGGAGNYCMTNQEDSSTLTALKRLDDIGKVDYSRVFVLRTASNFDQQYPGQTAIGSLGTSSGGFVPSLQNAYLVGSTVTDHIMNNWHTWRHGVPPLP